MDTYFTVPMGVFFLIHQLQVQRQRWFVVEGKEKASVPTLFFPPPQTTAGGKHGSVFPTAGNRRGFAL
jgi:hypothetical protein